MGKLPSDLPSRLAVGKYAETVYVRVSSDGLADEAYADPACTQKVKEAYLQTVVRKILFKPALRNGKAVDSTASFKLGELAI